MENLKENQNSEMKSGINEKRLKALKGNYQKPEISNFIIQDNSIMNCSDMASVACPAGGNCSPT